MRRTTVQQNRRRKTDAQSACRSNSAGESVHGLQRFQIHFKLVIAAAAAALFAAFVWSFCARSPAESVNRLIAQAYTEHRTVEIRIQGAAYAPLSIERGSTGASIDHSAALLQAALSIRKHLGKNRNDPKWLQAKARVDLLDGKYDDAIHSLRQALEVAPESPSLQIDLASGFFERAQSFPRPLDYGDAIEYLGEVLAKTPDDQIALFNRAMACEKAFLYIQAINDWEHYLRLDPDSLWAIEARRHLADVRAIMQARKQRMAEPLLNPLQFHKLNSNDKTSFDNVDERIEEYLSTAILDWLPSAFPGDRPSQIGQSDLRIALQVLAQWTRQRHRDTWLAELLSASSSPDFPAAVENLSLAVKANDDGDTVSAQRYASKADLLFTSSHNLAGALRARVEYVFATHIAQDGEHCLRTAASLAQLVEKRQYPWLRAQFRLEEGTCLWLTGDMGGARQLYLQAAKEAESARYSALYLRTQDHIAALDGNAGNFSACWERLFGALSRFWYGDYPPMRGYNLYYNLEESARMQKQPYLQAAIWTGGVTLSDFFSDTALRAMAHSIMADAAIAAGQPRFAEEELTRSAQLFNLSPKIKATRIAHMEAETRLAAVKLRLADSESLTTVANQLEAIAPEIADLSDNFLATLFYTTLGQMEVRRHDDAKAESFLWIAIRFAELDLKSLKDDRSRLEWSQRSSATYRSLVELKLRKGDTTGALELWEWYRGASLRSNEEKRRRTARKQSANGADSSPQEVADNASPFSELRTVSERLPALTDTTILSFARLDNGFVAWAYDSRGITEYPIQTTPASVESLARNFRSLCSDPNSNIADIRKQGNAIYNLLIAPLQDRLSPDHILVIEADDVLTEVPFEALLDGRHRYLGDRFSVAFSLGLYYQVHARPSEPITPNSRVLIASVSRPATVQIDPIRPLPDVRQEADAVANHFQGARALYEREATLASVRSFLSDAEVFHFAGHASSSVRETALLLSDATLDYRSLRSVRLSRLQLAVLSGCGTAGNFEALGNDPESLVRLFTSARVPHVVASRWNIDSAATEQFMKEFYRILLRGSTVAQALREAASAMRANRETEHPYYWSAFTEFGVN